MSGSTIIPVAIGLAAGIAFLALFALIFESILPIQSIHNPPIPRAHEATTVIITIPEDASMPGGNFEPAIIKVVIGTNNTVRWVNHDTIPSSVFADNENDPLFYNATKEQCENNDYQNCQLILTKNILMPGGTFEFTFTRPGVFGYHSVPHPQMKGTVVVYPQDWQANGYVPTEPVKYGYQAVESVENYLKQRVDNYAGITLYATSSNNIPSNRSRYLSPSDFFALGNRLPLRYYPPGPSDSFFSIDPDKHEITGKCMDTACLPFNPEYASKLKGKLAYLIDSAWEYTRSNGELVSLPDGFWVDAYTGDIVATTFHCLEQKQEWCK